MLLSLLPLSQTYSSYGFFILQTLAALAVIALGAWALVRFGGPRFGRASRGGRMRVIERLTLEPKRSIYLVEIDGGTYLVGTSEGSVQLLKQIPGKGTEEGAPGTDHTPDGASS